MSPSTRSKPASASSPETGDEPDAGAAAEASTRAGGTVEVSLEVSWPQTAGWMVFELVVGVLLLWHLGTVGKWVGVLLIVRGAFKAFDLVQMLRNPPGTISVSAQRVVLPRGLSLGKPLVVTPPDVTAAYFLRRSVPWNRSAPVLVVELGKHAMAFPRDWFATEADQRRVIHALMAVMPKDPAPRAGSDPAIEPATTLWAQLAVGLVLMAVSAVGFVALSSAGSAHPLWIAPLATGFILCWRVLTRW